MGGEEQAEWAGMDVHSNTATRLGRSAVEAKLAELQKSSFPTQYYIPFRVEARDSISHVPNPCLVMKGCIFRKALFRFGTVIRCAFPPTRVGKYTM